MSYFNNAYNKMCDVLRVTMTSNNTKKIVIKNKFSKFEGNVAESDITTLENAVKLIYKSSTLNVTYEDLYRIVENLCTHNMKEDVYYNLYKTVDDYLQMQLNCLNYDDNNQFLNVLNKLWTDFCQRTKLINNIYIHLDRSIINDKTFKNSIWSMNLLLFKNNIIMCQEIKVKLITLLLNAIQNEREYVAIDNEIVKSLIQMLSDLQIYEELFEQDFLHKTDEFYKDETQRFINCLDIIDYLNYANRRIKEEEKRVADYLLLKTESALISIINNRLLVDHLEKILYDSINKLIDEDQLEVLALLYELLKKIPKGHAQLEKYFTDFIIKRGLSVVKDAEKDKCMIQFLLDFKSKVDDVVTKSFCKNVKFYETVKNSFKHFINQRHNKPAELLAKFVDGILKSKNPEEDVEEILDKVMVIFRFVQGKDIFEAFYKKDLCKRLLVGKSSSQDAEYSMISKLKLECGSCFTAKLEGMFKDVRLSYDINNSFKQHLSNNKSNFSFDMNVNVLTSSYWPNFNNDTISLPEQMIQCQSTFQKFYLNSYSGRKLQWQPNLGSCILKAKFDTGPKELQVSLFQTVVLLLFNISDHNISYKEIEENTNMKAIELKRTLQSLACGKIRVLHKMPKGKDVEETDSFVLKKDFTDKLFRVKINQIQMKETIEEQKATEQSVFQDRQFQIDAAIVRIMKHKKVLIHNELIAELYKTFDLPIKAVDFKKRIEQLIEREYIERDKENGNLYKYVA